MSEKAECHRLIHLLSDYVDGELDESLCRELEEHINGCDNCRIVVNTLKKTVSLYQTEENTCSCPDDVRERLYKRLNLEDYIR
jgi:anti-sigma factor RsiW